MRRKKPDPNKPWTQVYEDRPVPKGRPRLGRRGRVFTPETTLNAEAVIRDGWEGPIYEGTVQIMVDFSPDGTTVTVAPYDGLPSKLRGDVDNYLKLLMDGLNGAAWADDKQVHYVEVVKR